MVEKITFFMGTDRSAFSTSPSGVTDYTGSGFNGENFPPSGAGLSFNANVVGIYAEANLINPNTGQFTTTSDFWTHVRVKTFELSASRQFLVWYNDQGAAVVRLYSDANRAMYLQYSSDLGTTWINASNDAFDTGVTQSGTDLDVRIKIHPTQGRIELYVNSQNYQLATNINTSALGSGISKFRLFRISTFINSNSTYNSVIAANYCTIGHTLRIRKITGNGDLSQWTGGFAGVGEYPTSDDDYVSTSIAGNRSTFTGATLTATPSGNVIKAVGVQVRGRNDASGVAPQDITASLRIASTNYDAPSTTPLLAGNDGRQYIWNNDPSTGLPWTSITSVNNTQPGVLSKN